MATFGGSVLAHAPSRRTQAQEPFALSFSLVEARTPARRTRRKSIAPGPAFETHLKAEGQYWEPVRAPRGSRTLTPAAQSVYGRSAEECPPASLLVSECGGSIRGFYGSRI